MPSKLAYKTTSDVARQFGVDSSAVHRWVLAGKLHPTVTTPGGHHRFTDDDIAAMNNDAVALAAPPSGGDAVSSPKRAASPSLI